MRLHEYQSGLLKAVCCRALLGMAVPVSAGNLISLPQSIPVSARSTASPAMRASTEHGPGPHEHPVAVVVSWGVSLAQGEPMRAGREVAGA